MTKNKTPNMTDIQVQVRHTKTSRDLSYRQFANALAQHMMQGAVSYQTIKDWIDGKYEPSLPTLCEIAYFAPPDSWEHKFVEQLIRLVVEEIDG